jgi:putative membrane protein
MKLIPGLLVAALAVPLSFASQQTNANQTDQRGSTGQQSGAATDNRDTSTQSDRNTDGRGSTSRQSGAASDHHGTAADRSDRQTGQTDATAGRSDQAGQTDTTAGTRSRTAETAESMVSPADRRFMTEAAQGGVAEVQLAQLAQQKASSDEVKQLAKTIEEDHQKANDQLKQIAANRNVDLPAEPGPKHKQLMTKLERLEGAAFDKAYTDAMVKEHKADVKKFQKQAQNGVDTDVREFAENTLPALQKHLDQAQQTKNSTRSRSR